ncbi:MAG TPA: GNAT family N-acetyltransferase [Thermoplasmata archaeon]|jgi:GNAT superfamily N-acetyltransferase|nr:GNAT family N-acetyltransferase [Thermoplasmata archaeon]
MATGVRVRRATVADLDRLAPLFAGYRAFYRGAPDRRRERAFLAARLARGESVVFLAEVEGRPIGFTQLYPVFSSVAMRPLWILNDLFVVPDARRRGVGAALLGRAKAWARATGAEGLTLETAVDNPAQRLYEAQGWTRDTAFLHYELLFPPRARRPRRRRA